jgi:hypothetical protein
MAELHTGIEIDASAETVWLLLTDFENYPNWNPFIHSIEGEQKEGAPLKIFIKPSGGSGMTLKPNVVDCIPNKKFSWLGSLFVKGLFDGRHEFLIETISENKTKFVQREFFSGILVPPVWALIKKNTQRGFEEMNAALKVQAEKS